jgi:polysaccharide chain length determinant protein (PEP-CTERM system associated)
MIDRAVDQWRRRKWLLIVCFLSVFTVAVCLIAALPPLYRSSTTMLFTQDEVAESLLKTTASNELELRLGAIQQAVMSRTQLQEVIDEFDLYGPMKGGASPESVINQFRKDIRIDQQASTAPQWGQHSNYAITISYQGWDPDRVAPVANELAARFRAENERIRTVQAATTTAFVRKELAAAKTRFEAEERRINDFKNAHMGELPEQQAFNMATLDRLNSQLRLNGERQVHLLERRDGALPSAGESGAGTGVTGLTGIRRLEWLKRDLAERETRFTANHPDIIRLKAEIDSLTRALAQTGAGDEAQVGLQQDPADPEAELRTLRREEGRLRGEIGGLVRTLEGTPRIEQELKRLANDYNTARDEFLAMQKHYQDAYLAESLETRQNQQFKVIEMAIAPDGPVAPDRTRLFFLGFILAVGFAGVVLFLAEQLDRSFHSIAEIRRFTTLPVLASIPRVLTPGDQWRSRARFGLLSVIVVAGLLAMAGCSYYAGTHAEQLVLAISN